ncbi:hypothetical protein SAMN05421770_102227 [Granulicella rosea]|uniref:HEAT repeat-containing protein n=1 Tax=Granulicella rosea TaxID=474952 RepID=A0A239H7Z3_9BACT|nr:hypothetical protein [Granulicella rosea]SNS76374.1 hypothetical protein SAMN05421770_102227 [Granulicella rosea]
MKKLLAAALVLASTAAHAQTTLTQRFTEVLHRAETGHSPTPEDMAATADPSQPVPDAASIADAMPLILKAVDNPDVQVRQYALLTLQSFRSGDVNPVYKGGVASALAPAVPKIAPHLTEENTQNRLLTAIVLGGFGSNPPATVFPPLLAYLKRDDAISPIGLNVVEDLLSLGPISAETAAAVSRYLRRSDQTSDSRSNLVDAIATQPNQSQAVNATLVAWMDSDDNSLRARVILSLPQLDLPAESFSDTRARVGQLAQNESENLQVVTAAKSIAPCWTAPHMTTPCPVYDTGEKPAGDTAEKPAAPPAR